MIVNVIKDYAHISLILLNFQSDTFNTYIYKITKLHKLLKSKDTLNDFSTTFSVSFKIETPTALQHNASLMKPDYQDTESTHHYCNSARTYSRYGISLSQAIYIATLFA